MTNSNVSGYGMGSGGINYAGITNLNISQGGFDNTLAVKSTFVTTNTAISTGTSTVEVANLTQVWNNAGTLAGIAGPLSITGQGDDALNVSDFGDSSAASGVLTANNISGFGMGPSGINYAGIAFLNLWEGNGGNTLAVRSTSAISETIVTTGSGTNATTVGNLSNTLSGIAFWLSIAGQGPNDTLNTFDFGDAAAASGVLTSDNLSGFDMGPFGIAYTGIKNLNLFEGNGGNKLFVKSTSATTQTVVDTGAGSNFTGVWSNNGTLADIAGPLQINGQGPSDALALSDADDSSAAIGVVTNTSITGFGMGASGVGYVGIKQLNLLEGSAGDMLEVRGTSSGTNTSVATGDRDECSQCFSDAPIGDGGLGAIQGPLVIAGQGANDTLNVSDRGDARRPRPAPSLRPRSLATAWDRRGSPIPISRVSMFIREPVATCRYQKRLEYDQYRRLNRHRHEHHDHLRRFANACQHRGTIEISVRERPTN